MSDEIKATGEEEQEHLFDIEPDWKDSWAGMPEFGNKDLTPASTLMVHFASQADRTAFSKLVDQPLSAKTQYIWYPKAKIEYVADKRYVSTAPLNPRYPVYVPTKGRWESALTIKALEALRVPYFAVVQPQEKIYYEQVVKTGTFLLLPAGLDGLVPARNWIFEHAKASGALRHWQIDDNIRDFYRFHDNQKIRVGDGTIFRCMEDFADRYENIAIAGPQYEMFAPRRQDLPPVTLNTRVYSCSLISCTMEHRYRGVYNDDTDICLRAMKAGLCTVQFNAFLAKKIATMKIKGGNTPIYLGAEDTHRRWLEHAASCKTCQPDVSPVSCKEGREILQLDGRWRMAESLREQHPEVTTIERKWDRWQHQVDYRRFASNKMVLRPDAVIPDHDIYGFVLQQTAQLDEPDEQDERIPESIVQFAAAQMAQTIREDQARAAAPSAFNLGQEFVTKVTGPEGPEAPSIVGPAAPVPQAPAAPSALDFAGPPTEPEAPDTPALAEPSPQAPAPRHDFEAELLKADLMARGHRVLTKDGRLFTTNSQLLTAEDRAQLKALKPRMLEIADPVPDAAPAVPATQSIMFGAPAAPSATDFIASPSAARDDAWRPDEPPDLSNVKDLILNFATTGLRWDKGDRPCGLTVSTMDGQLRRFLPFAFQYGGNHDEAVIKRWAQEQLRGKKITNSKTRFDCHMSREWGVDLEAQGCTFSDIQHTAALLDDHRKRFALDVLAKEYLPDVPMVARLDESRHAQHHASEVAQREYFSTELVQRLTALMQPEIDKQELRAVHDLEDSVIRPVVEMEKNGAPIDLELLEAFGKECNSTHDELMWDIAREAGFAFEHAPEGWTRLLEKLGLPVPDNFDEATLSEYDHPLVKKGQLASQFASLNSKVFKAYKQQLGDDDLLRFEVNQLRGDDGGTVSGRFSIGYVQQVPNHDNHHAIFGEGLVDDCLTGLCHLFPRRLYTSRTGSYLAADASQIEYRLFAHYANNAEVLEAYRKDPLLSFHKMTYARMKVYKADMLYTHQKSFNFARQYGAKSIKLAVMMKFITERIGAEIKRAKRWDDPRLNTIHEIERAYAKMMPEGDLLLARASHLAKSSCDEFCKPGDKLHRTHQHKGFVKTLLGRRSRFPNNYKTYIGLNRVLQGSGADILKQKMVELHDARFDTGFLMRMTVHDELGGDSQHEEALARVMAILNRQSFPQLRVPILWTGKTGRTWADCK